MKRSFTKMSRIRSGGLAPRTHRSRVWSPLARLWAPAWLLTVIAPTPALASSPTGVLGRWLGSAVLAPSVNRVDGLTVEEHHDGTTVLRLRGSAKPTFNVYRLQEPDRLVVDIASSERGQVVPRLPLDTWAASRVTVDGVRERDADLVRVVVELKREVSWIVVPDGNNLVVTVTPRQMPPEAYFERKSAGERQAELEAKARDVERMHRDAAALKAEAKAIGAHASAKAKATAADAVAAEERARSAKEAERAARDAEAAARQAEARAKQALAEALADEKNSRFGARRLRKQAQAEMERAQAERSEAQRARADARAEFDCILAHTDQSTEQQLADATARARVTEAEARRKRASATARAKKTEQQAARTLSEARKQAEQAEAAAQAKLASARAAGRKAEALAQQKVAAAQAEADQAKAEAATARRAAKAADADARRRLARAQEAAEARQLAAEKELELARKQAEQVKTEAGERLARAQQSADAAQRRAEEIIATAEAKAESTLASARIRASEEAKQTLDDAEAEARRVLDKAKADAEQETRRRLHAAQKAADEKIARAETEARERARARIRQAEEEAGRKLAQAQSDAQQQAAEAAKKELVRVRAEAEARIAKEVAAAREQARTQADQDLAKARERARAESEARVAEARVRADALQAEAKQTQKKAEAELAAAETMRKQAEQALATAATAMKDAEAEKKASTAARKDAEQTLADAKREAAAARKHGKLTTDLDRAVQKARRERDEAIGRQEVAQRDLAKLRADHDRLEAKLAERQALAAQLDGKIAAKERRLSEMEAEVTAARSKLDTLGGSASKKELEAARQQAMQVQATATVLEKEVQRLRAAAKEAGSRASVAEARVAELERSGARREQLQAARVDLQSAKSEAAAVKRDLSQRTRRLDEVSERLRSRQEEVQALERTRTELAAHGKQLQAENATARERLREAETELGRLEKSVQAERSKLASVEREVAEARSSLDERLATLQERERRLSEARRPETLERKPKAGGVATIRDVRFEQGETADRVVIAIDGPLQYDDRTLTPNLRMLELRGAKMPKALERSLDARAYQGPVKLVTSFEEGEHAKVVVSTHGPSKPRLEERAGELVWHFPHEATRAASPRATEAVTLAGSKVGGFASAPKPTALLAQPEGSLADPAETGTTRRTRFRGERIDIELQDAPIKDVLLLFSDIGRVNIIAGRGVEGTVTMKLSAVPWDQALDIILRSLNLGSVREGNVIRVATLDDLEAERRAAIERANARVQLKPLETRLMPVSYATVAEMVPKVQSVLSPRGQVTPDTRTNTLIIMDIAENIALAEQLVRSLDTQTPQVLIEARIVEARTTFTRQLGIQWGFDYIASPGTGNPTGLLFPNSVGVGGGGTGQPPDTRGLVLPAAAANPNYAVDLPAPVGTRQGGAIGFSFGSISGNLNTNLRLSAAETTGEVRIISAPKIVTLDNSQAQIEQGVQIPISQVSAQGVNTRFVRATLSLEVTPHVTAEGAVLLDVVVQKNEADFINTGARGDPTILTRQAQSRMLVNDSDTAVIGGIYTRNKAVNFAKIPWLADIPIIGWFFKNKSEADTRSEVLIFLTPKIVNRAASIGG